MAEGEAVIRVYAQFPDNPRSLARTNWNWVHCLTFPVQKLSNLQFSSKPYKWIRYATGVVVGAQGHLSTQRDSVIPVDYEAGSLLDSTINLYYRLSDEERLHMFPTDAGIAGSNVTSSDASTRRATFRERVQERDGNRCVVANVYSGHFCDAAHLVDHAKGDLRDNSDVIGDVDDPCNGLFLNRLLHSALRQEVAILVTPNFAMETGDLLQGGAAVQGQAGKRFTAHLFDATSPHSFGDPAITSGSPIRVPAGDAMSTWPPDLLFDVVYASAVMLHFGDDTKVVLEPWQKMFYPTDGPMTPLHAEQLRLHNQRAEYQRKCKQQDSDRTKRVRRRRGDADHGDAGIDDLDALMFLPYICMSPERVLSYWRRQREETAAREHEALNAKVSFWREGVSTTDT